MSAIQLLMLVTDSKFSPVAFSSIFDKFCMQLDEMLAKQGTKIDKVLNFAIDDTILEQRITGRRIHPASGRTYHSKFAPPKVPGIDDVSGYLFISN